MSRQARFAAFCTLAAAGIALLAASLDAAAQGWPGKPVRIVSSYTAGGPNDVFSRIVATRLSERLGQPVIVENRVGADGRIGAESVARAAPDGYTLLMLALAHTAHPALYGKLPYDVERDFAPITEVASVPLVLVVANDVPANTVAEFVALAKRRPGALNYGSGGNGTSQHLAMELFAGLADIRIQHVPYKGMGPIFTDLLNGQLQAVMSPVAAALPHIKAGKLKALAIAAPQRSPLMPEVPTMIEAGVPGHVVDTWHGLVAPAGTPPEVVDRLSREVRALLAQDEVRQSFAAQGSVPVGNTPEQFGAEIRLEIVRWGKVVRERNIQAQ